MSDGPCPEQQSIFVNRVSFLSCWVKRRTCYEGRTTHCYCVYSWARCRLKAHRLAGASLDGPDGRLASVAHGTLDGKSRDWHNAIALLASTLESHGIR